MHKRAQRYLARCETAYFWDRVLTRNPVTSSNLRSIGYDAASQTLEVEFTNGGVYQYFGVPEAVYRGLMSAASHGTYFDQHVKKAGYRYARR